MLFLGLVLESRHTVCSDPEGNVSNDTSLCDAERKPELSRDCEAEEVQKVNKLIGQMSIFNIKNNNFLIDL